ncbi:hypothetical protein Pmani_006686 [Petrolisthes manimaculis]|uniref:Uncharacterized protein n=1 Tax=Petrolisthes manimaculis TaxID=1843537 RepID=A0AAE1Q9A1_9EUCA|nr:hypothetical protein Pmani_006686 [Petrolisthes manimaculis]
METFASNTVPVTLTVTILPTSTATTITSLPPRHQSFAREERWERALELVQLKRRRMRVKSVYKQTGNRANQSGGERDVEARVSGWLAGKGTMGGG